jgi:dihydrolipoamide dehydrogenase
VSDVVIIGGGPGGYEAALVAAQLGATVHLIEQQAVGGSAVLTDCVPSKALIATAESVTTAAESGVLGVRLAGTGVSGATVKVGVDPVAVNSRIKALAAAQSDDIGHSLRDAGVTVIAGRGRLLARDRVQVTTSGGDIMELRADAVLLATGARPRTLPGSDPDGSRIVTWEQLYELAEVPPRVVVIGSGVTGAEFASAYHALGSQVVLVSSRDRVLPSEDPDAAQVLEEVFANRGLEVLANSRAERVERTPDGVQVHLEDGRTVVGSHCLVAVGSQPNTADLGLEAVGVRTNAGGFIETDRVSRTSVSGVYAAGDCTGVMLLASTAAMQGRIAMRHVMGDAVVPLDTHAVCSTVFTDPEIATVGWTQADVDAGRIDAVVQHLPLATNARAKMVGLNHGFVKLFCRPGTGIVVGGVVVAPRASELVFSLAIAVDQQLSVDQLANSFTVYPSLSGSIAEAARRLHLRD